MQNNSGDYHGNGLVQFSHSVMANSLQPHGLQNTRFPCPSPTPRAYSNSCPSSWCNHLILCRPLLFLPPIFPSISVFSSEPVPHIRWPNDWSFSFSISSSSEQSGLISFRMDWLDILAVQGTLKSLLQHQFKSINSSAPSLLYDPTLTSVYDYGKNHSFDYMGLCQQSDVSAF